LIAEGKFENDVEEGQWYFYFNSGYLKIIGAYKAGKENGLWGNFHENQSLKIEETWQDGKLMHAGAYFTAFGDSISSGSLKNGTGTLQKFYNDKSLQEELTFKDGEKNGSAKLYFETGKIAAEGKYLNNKKEDLWKYYYSNGRVESQGKYKEDELEGLWMFFNKAGNTIDKKDYTKLKRLEQNIE
jgi:antitoxin component YwqK of YwqJK toxin-antitoxin module